MHSGSSGGITSTYSAKTGKYADTIAGPEYLNAVHRPQDFCSQDLIYYVPQEDRCLSRLRHAPEACKPYAKAKESNDV